MIHGCCIKNGNFYIVVLIDIDYRRCFSTNFSLPAKSPLSGFGSAVLILSVCTLDAFQPSGYRKRIGKPSRHFDYPAYWQSSDAGASCHLLGGSGKIPGTTSDGQNEH
ncbi:MAG: hypothetical protein HFF85_07930 [Oscillibacter sp.]|nr:hypothetical protein [Oscillibacter sp.]MCI9376312.1 hypothetical protein [Oscillibacter sp.]